MGDGICPFDPFGEGRYMYPFENICLVDRIRAMLESEKPRTVRVAFSCGLPRLMEIFLHVCAEFSLFERISFSKSELDKYEES